MLDSPENNFCTLNSIYNHTGSSFSEGNLKVSTGSSEYGPALSTFAQSSGKWYAEFAFTSTSGDTRIGGVRVDTALSTTYDTGNSGSFAYRQNDGNKKIDGTQTSYGATWTASDIIAIAINLDDDEVTFYKNNVSQGTFSITTGEYFIAVSDGDSGAGGNYLVNFGQDSTFAGNTTAGGNTDGNGKGDFKYSVPSGYLALCTANLPEPTISPNEDTQADDYFNTVTYTGNGTGQSITGVGFQSDWTWIKRRSATEQHWLTDSVRGVTKGLFSANANAEATRTDQIQSFDTDGFTLGNDGAGYTNINANTYVSWNWKAGGTAVSNTDGSITSSVSANTDAGFSIVSYTGNGSLSTVGHSLGVKPSMMIIKNRDDSDSGSAHWLVYHEAIGATHRVKLDSTEASGATSVHFNNTEPTSSVFTVNTSNAGNGSSDDLIAYCFAEIEGFSKFGSYTGNGLSDGTFVYTGFRPAFIITKTSSHVSSWSIVDTTRDPFNIVNQYILAESSGAEGDFDSFDILSNGFKARTTNAERNGSGRTVIYMAFAEAPFKYANAR
jgi:hypothetical protein